MLTKGAIGNLINRYKAVLKKCNLINTFGSLAVASMLVMGGAGVAGATAGDFSYITEGGPIYIGKNNIVSSSEDLTQNPDTFNKDNNQDIIITVNTNQGLSNPIKFKSGASIVTTGNINLNSAEGLEFGESSSNTIAGKDISISGKLDNDGTLNINAGNDFQLSNSHLCGDGTFNITAENDIFLSGDKKPVINTGANIALSAKNNVTITGTTIDSSLLDAKDFKEVLKLDGRKIAILFDEAHQSYTAGQNLTINGDVLFFNNGSLNLEAVMGNVEITGVVSNRPEAVADENYVKEVNISCGGSSTISGTNVTINGEVWNERSHDPEITMTINATDTLTIIGSVDNQSELNITAGSLIHTGGEKDGYLNFDGNNAITVTSNATIGDGNVAPIVAAGNLNFTAGGTAAINGGKVTDAEIIKYAPAVANRTLAILGATLETSPDTTQAFTANTLQIDGDIVATDRSTVALTAIGDGSFITGNILTTDSAKVTMDGAFTMNGMIEKDTNTGNYSNVILNTGSLTVDAATLGTADKVSGTTLGIQSGLTVGSGATLILDSPTSRVVTSYTRKISLTPPITPCLAETIRVTSCLPTPRLPGTRVKRMNLLRPLPTVSLP